MRRISEGRAGQQLACVSSAYPLLIIYFRPLSMASYVDLKEIGRRDPSLWNRGISPFGIPPRLCPNFASKISDLELSKPRVHGCVFFHFPNSCVMSDNGKQMDPAHLSDSLHRLIIEEQAYTPRTPPSRDGYGFRTSGIASPLPPLPSEQPQFQTETLVPDPNGLGWPAKSTVDRLNATEEEKRVRDQKMAAAVRTILECIGEDPDREGLLRTPERYAKALLWMTKGYEERLVGEPKAALSVVASSERLFLSAIDVINDAVFAEDHDEMVIVKEIEFSSLCEHHLVPFTGKV